jgi:hypothetical protein
VVATGCTSSTYAVKPHRFAPRCTHLDWYRGSVIGAQIFYRLDASQPSATGRALRLGIPVDV